MTLPSGTKLGRYEIRSKIGEGGMGEVYLAEDMKLHRKVALKILPIDLAANKDRLRRFEQEAKAAAALNHPNIAHIYEIGDSEGTNFIAMEFIDGVTLGEKIHSERTELKKLLRFMQHSAEGLAKAHAAGIVHRDLKPANIMVTRDGHAKILDFGLAKLVEPQRMSGSGSSEVPTAILQHSQSGAVLGTVGYMSPEQAQGKTKEIDQRSDIFSFGCILYEVVTGRKPFEGSDAIDSLNKIIREPPPLISSLSPDTPADLERVIKRCLAKDQEDRYQSIKDVAIELRELRQESMSRAGVHIPTPLASLGSAAATYPVSASPRTGAPSSSAEYIVSGIKRHRVAVGIILAAVVVGGLVLGIYLQRRNAVSVSSIAVLPFVNASGSDDVEYLSDGMTESLINSLSQLPHLTVKARSSVFRYKGKEIDPQKVAAELSVQAILNGRVVQRGDDLTLYLSLVDGRNGNQIWGDRYDQKLTNIVMLQSEIARDVSEKLRLKLSMDEEQRVGKKSTADAAAYQHYLKGRFYLLQYTPEGHKSAIEHLNEAIRLDPNYALAWAGLADTYTASADLLMPPREALPKARSAAEKALTLDETLAEAHAALGHIFLHQLNPAAERELQRALELNPNSVEARLWSAEYFSPRDETKAIAVLKQAQELDPLSTVSGQFMVATYFFNRHFDEAVVEAQKTLQLDPNDPSSRSYLAFAYGGQGKHAEAIAILEDLRQKLPVSRVLAALGMEYAITGRRNDALNMIAAMNELSRQQYVSPYHFALIYTALGDREQAFASLQKAFEDQSEYMLWLRLDYRLDGLRSDSRFQDLVRRVEHPS